MPGTKISLPVVAKEAQDKKEQEKLAKAYEDLKKAAGKKTSVTLTAESVEDKLALESFAPAKK